MTFTYDVSHRTNHRLWITARHATVERVSKCRVENDDHGARMHMTRRHYPQGTNICIGVLKRPACFLSARSESWAVLLGRSRRILNACGEKTLRLNMLHEKGRHPAPFLSEKFFRREKASDVGVLRLDLTVRCALTRTLDQDLAR